MKIVEIKSKKLDSYLKGLRRSTSLSDPKLESATKKIVDDVKKNGNKALFKYTKRFDKVDLNNGTVKVTAREIEHAQKHVSSKIKANLRTAARRVREFHKHKMPKGSVYKDSLGNELGWLIRPIERAGLYVPGGKAAYPSTVLMTAIPAKVAGVQELVLVTPCPHGELNPTVLVAASIAGVDSIYKVGGAQAVRSWSYQRDV